MKGRRRQKRYVKRFEVEFAADGTACRGISSDFSLNGFFIWTDFRMAPNTPLDMMIHLADGSVSKVKVRVAWSRKNAMRSVAGTPRERGKNGMGVEIIEKDANYIHLIRSLLG